MNRTESETVITELEVRYCKVGYNHEQDYKWTTEHNSRFQMDNRTQQPSFKLSTDFRWTTEHNSRFQMDNRTQQPISDEQQNTTAEF
ncbi:hypothetical protein BaRGS_00021833 [Batillaria attramentaria]|uniref:Uncharacterized protein n=1 Tax=Batillaria attramentaria TaxID=370345 RepID=A0ABD0KIS1_9CAEN